MRDLVGVADTFLSDVLPQAAVSVSWDITTVEKAFRWALHAEEMHIALKEEGKLAELEEALAQRGRECEKPSLYRSSNLEKATIVLFEEFLRNPNLSDEDIFRVCKGMSKQLDPPQFQEICEQVAERKNVYHQTVDLIQTNQDVEAVTLMKAMILKEDLMINLDSQVLKNKLDPLLKTLPTLEILLTVLGLAHKSEHVADTCLSVQIVEVFEALVDNWLRGTGKGHTIAALLAAPVKLTRQVAEISSSFQELWQDCLGRLASRLNPVYYAEDHVWTWPDEYDPDDVTFRGLWFSFDQLQRQFQSLLTPYDDHVGRKCLQFLAQRQQSIAGCSIWLEVEQRVALPPQSHTLQ